MEITGWDSVVFTFHQPQAVLAQLQRVILERWPTALVEGLNESLERLADVPREQFFAVADHLLFYRDSAMARHLRDFGYTPMTDGTGPFAVIFRRRQKIEFELFGRTEHRAMDHQRHVAQPPKPYHAWLCTPLVFEVTAVTPGDPSVQPFSAWILAEVKRACGYAEDDSAG